MINASASYHFYENDERELLRELEMRRVQLERQGESELVPGRMRQALSWMTATMRARRQSTRRATQPATQRAIRQPAPRPTSRPGLSHE
jgi:hypothetical protein